MNKNTNTNYNPKLHTAPLRSWNSPCDQRNVSAPVPILSKYGYMGPLITPPSPQVIKNDFALCVVKFLGRRLLTT